MKVLKIIAVYFFSVILHAGTICGFGWDFVEYSGRSLGMSYGIMPFTGFLTYKPFMIFYMLYPGSWLSESIFSYFFVFLFWIGFCGVIVYKYHGFLALMIFNALSVGSYYHYNSLLGCIVYFAATFTLLSVIFMLKGRYLFAGIFAGLSFCTRLYLTAPLLFLFYGLEKKLSAKDLYLYVIGFLAVWLVVFFNTSLSDIFIWLGGGNIEYISQ